MMVKYHTKIKVDGLGEYEIEVKNVIDVRTLQEKPLVPTLMSFTNT